MKANLAVLMLIIAGFSAMYARRENRLARSNKQALSALLAGSGKNTGAIADAETRLAAAEKDRIDLQSRLAAFAQISPAKVTVPVKKTAAETIADLSRIEEQRRKDPQVQLRQLAAMRTKLMTRYGALYWKLHLTPHQIERFEVIAAKRDEQYADLFEAVVAQGVKTSDPEFGKLYTPLRTKIDEDYRAVAKELLGEDGYQQFRVYERELSARNYVQSVAGASVIAGTSFSPQQAEQLVGIVANASANYRKGGEVNSLDIDWDAVDAQARKILSAEQLTALQTLESVNGSARPWLLFSRAMGDARNADSKRATSQKPAGG